MAKALYGVRGDPSKQVDLTASIRQNIADGKFTLRADNATAGRDPAYGAEKTLELEYTINGRGPTPKDTCFDRVDLTKHLRQGDNTIAVLVWYFGKDGFSHKSSGKAIWS